MDYEVNDDHDLTFRHHRISNQYTVLNTPLGSVLDRYLYNSLYCRNTKRSIGTSYKVNHTTHQYHTTTCSSLSVDECWCWSTLCGASAGAGL